MNLKTPTSTAEKQCLKEQIKQLKEEEKSIREERRELESRLRKIILNRYMELRKNQIKQP